MSQRKFENHEVIRAVRAALGRQATPEAIPPPPEIPEHVVRLVHTELGLLELFVARAAANAMRVHELGPEELSPRILARLGELGHGRVLLGASPLLEKLEVPSALRTGGIELGSWKEVGLAGAWDYPVGLTDVWAGVAETGSIVLRGSAGTGRAVSLLPTVHFAVVEPRVLVPDLVDLFARLGDDNSASATVIINAPSRTADIELQLVTGVHGPHAVELFVLR